MAKLDYMPNDDEGKARLFVRFRDGIGPYLAALEIAPDAPEILAQAADATRFRALLDFAVTMQRAAKAWTAQKDRELDGSGNVSGELVVPAMGPDFPPPAAPGIVKRFRKTVAWVKTRPGYNDAMGIALGVVGVQRARPDLATIAPEIDAQLVGGRVEIAWGWQGLRDWVEGIQIEVDRSDGHGFVLLTIDFTAGTVDTTPLPAQLTRWKYRAIFRKNDAPIGQWSKTVSINVGG